MPAISYSDLDSNLKPQPAWRFYTTLPNISGSSTLNGQILSLLVENINVPLPGINFEPAFFNATERHFPNLRNIGQIQISFAETTNLDVAEYLEAWRKLIIDDNGNYSLPSQWKKPITLEPIDETGAANKTLTWQGCAPTLVDTLNFDGSASRHVQIAATFVVDQMDPF